MASPAGDIPSYSSIDMTASHLTALSLSYTMHPPYVTGQISQRTSQNTLSPSWATSGGRSARTKTPTRGITIVGAQRVSRALPRNNVGNPSSTFSTNPLPRRSLSVRRFTSFSHVRTSPILVARLMRLQLLLFAGRCCCCGCGYGCCCCHCSR